MLSPCLPGPGYLATPLAPLDDEERGPLPASLPAVIDAHVHLFPPRMFEAIWRWFDANAWPVRHKLEAPAVIRFLLDRGVERIVALHYAHKPRIALAMNPSVARPNQVAADRPLPDVEHPPVDHPGIVAGEVGIILRHP